jgi:hypothetical protein
MKRKSLSNFLDLRTLLGNINYGQKKSIKFIKKINILNQNASHLNKMMMMISPNTRCPWQSNSIKEKPMPNALPHGSATESPATSSSKTSQKYT